MSTTRDIALKWWEDSNGPEDCTVRQVLWPESNDELRHYVIDDMQKWVAFMEHYPLEVTNQKRGDWNTCTGRQGRWVMPNYTAAAEEWDAVMLTPRAYLLLSGNSLPVEVNRDAGAHTRSGEALCLLAGWSPGETYWLSSDVQFSTSPVTWTLAEDGRIVDAQL